MKQLRDDQDMRQKCNEMANMFLFHRQIGESEAVYKVLANMRMTYSSMGTIYVATEPKSQRSNFLKRQDPESGEGFEIEDKKGRFLEKQDLVSKYERRKLLTREGEEDVSEDEEDAKTLEQMCFCQFVKMYQGRERKNNE